MTETPPFDPFLWLEDIESEKSLRWVREQNEKTISQLTLQTDYHQIYTEIAGIILANDRVPFATFQNGYFWNFWQDDTNQQGILRRATAEEYKKDQPQWETILDLDDLSQKEKENWVYKGDVRLDVHSPLGLLFLSRGGKDAIVVREFNYDTKKFVSSNGFMLNKEAKTHVTPLDEVTLVIASNFGEGSLTDSGYPRLLKLWHRGEDLSKSQTVFEVNPTDLSASAVKFHDGDQNYVVFRRAIDFFNAEYFLQQNENRLLKLSLPTSAQLLDIKANFVYLLLKQPWISQNRNYTSNSILRFKLEDNSLNNAQVLFSATHRQSIEEVAVSRGQIFVNVLDHIRSKVFQIKLSELGAEEVRPLPFPDKGKISFVLKDERDSNSMTVMTFTDHLTPSSQYVVHDEDESYRLELLKKAPDRFDSTKYEVIQNWATSKDGTQIPYFMLKRKDLKLDGRSPTILYGYGGFELSLTPSYSGVIGKVWLDRGGVYVMANIRGGGEFGPQWHQAALREKRQNAFDDFIAVAEDLIRLKVTSPSHLGIEGASNGGLLVGVAMVQRPDLFNAVLSQVPLLDMVRFSKLLAGASWMGEYGNPEISGDCSYLLKYSPYHNIKPQIKYPKPFFTTSTKDDRVHPAHARKMSARMSEQGHPFLYYENINGGHSGSATLSDKLRIMALTYTYFWNQLK